MEVPLILFLSLARRYSWGPRPLRHSRSQSVTASLQRRARRRVRTTRGAAGRTAVTDDRPRMTALFLATQAPSGGTALQWHIL